MKRIFYSFFALSIMLSTGVSVSSCSSDDSSTENPAPVPPTPQEKVLEITASAESAYLGDTITLTAKLDGVDVTSTTTFYVDNTAISGNTVTSNEVADLLVYGKYQETTSELISIAFVENPFLGINGQGSFIYNGTTYQVDGAYLYLQGFYGDGNGGATAYWIQLGWNGDNPDTASNFVAIGFDTPATVSGESVTDYVLPDVNENMYYGLLSLQVNGQQVLEESYLDGTGVITYNNLNLEANPITADFNIALTGAYNLTFNYIGEVSPASSAKAKTLKTNKFSNVSSVVKSLKDKEALKKELITKFSK